MAGDSWILTESRQRGPLGVRGKRLRSSSNISCKWIGTPRLSVTNGPRFHIRLPARCKSDLSSFGKLRGSDWRWWKILDCLILKYRVARLSQKSVFNHQRCVKAQGFPYFQRQMTQEFPDCQRPVDQGLRNQELFFS